VTDFEAQARDCIEQMRLDNNVTFTAYAEKAAIKHIARALAEADRKAEIRTLEWALTQTVDRDGQIANRLAALRPMPPPPGKT
jgi:hypothetical protein